MNQSEIIELEKVSEKQISAIRFLNRSTGLIVEQLYDCDYVLLTKEKAQQLVNQFQYIINKMK